MNTLLYIALNNPTYYNEAICSILSIEEIEQKEKYRIILYSDNKDYFKKRISCKNIVFENVSDIQKKELLGRYNYLYRIKLGIIDSFCKKYECKFIFVDTDTFFLVPLDKLFKKITPDNSIFHAKEYSIGSYLNNSLSKYFLKENPMNLKDNKSIKELVSWNSGIIGLARENLNLISEALFWLDKLTPKLVDQRCLEQIILSFTILKNNNIITSVESEVIHYWYFKEFSSFLLSFFKISSIAPPELENHIDEIYNELEYSDLPTFMFKMSKNYRDKAYFQYHFQVFSKDSFTMKLFNSIYN